MYVNINHVNIQHVPTISMFLHIAGNLSRRLAKECSANIQLALRHTTASFHFVDHYIEITRSKFDDMLLAGDFLTYTEMDGESYGLSITFLFVVLTLGGVSIAWFTK